MARQTAQSLMLGLLKKSHLIENSKGLAEALRRNKKYWDSVIAIDKGYCRGQLDLIYDLTYLNALQQGNWSADAVFVLAPKKNKKKIAKLLYRFEPQELQVLRKSECEDRLGYGSGKCENKVLLRAWWD